MEDAARRGDDVLLIVIMWVTRARTFLRRFITSLIWPVEDFPPNLLLGDNAAAD